jgi:hypothetical protein
MSRFLSILVIFSILLTGCDGGDSQTSAEVKIVNVTEKSITVQDLGGVETIISIPTGISKLIEPNKHYFVKYESSSQGKKSKLISIEPSVDLSK